MVVFISLLVAGKSHASELSCVDLFQVETSSRDSSKVGLLRTLRESTLNDVSPEITATMDLMIEDLDAPQDKSAGATLGAFLAKFYSFDRLPKTDKERARALTRLADAIAKTQMILKSKTLSQWSRVLNAKKLRLVRIQTDLTLKASLRDQNLYRESLRNLKWLPDSWLSSSRVSLSNDLHEIWKSKGYDAFLTAVARRYSWRISGEIAIGVAQNAAKLGVAASTAVAILWLHGASSYFGQQLNFDDGLRPADHAVLEQLTDKSGFSSHTQVMKWIDEQGKIDPNLRQLHDDIQREEAQPRP
jgi:hypothetical protein